MNGLKKIMVQRYIIPTDEEKQAFIDKLTESKAILAKKLDDLGLPGTKWWKLLQLMQNNY